MENWHTFGVFSGTFGNAFQDYLQYVVSICKKEIKI